MFSLKPGLPPNVFLECHSLSSRVMISKSPCSLTLFILILYTLSITYQPTNESRSWVQRSGQDSHWPQGTSDVSLEPGPTQKWLPLEVKYIGTCIYWELYFCQYCSRSFTALSRLYSHRYMRKRDHKSTFRSKTEVRERWKKESLRNSHHWSCLFPNFLLLNTHLLFSLNLEKKGISESENVPTLKIDWLSKSQKPGILTSDPIPRPSSLYKERQLASLLGRPGQTLQGYF